MKNNNLKKVLILGGDGMFAYDMFNVLKKDKEFEPIPLSKEDLDITEKNEVLKYIISSTLLYLEHQKQYLILDSFDLIFLE